MGGGVFNERREGCWRMEGIEFIWGDGWVVAGLGGFWETVEYR